MANKNISDQNDAPVKKRTRKSRLEYHMEVSYTPLPPERARAFWSTLGQLVLEAIERSEKPTPDAS